MYRVIVFTYIIFCFIILAKTNLFAHNEYYTTQNNKLKEDKIPPESTIKWDLSKPIQIYINLDTPDFPSDLNKEQTRQSIQNAINTWAEAMSDCGLNIQVVSERSPSSCDIRFSSRAKNWEPKPGEDVPAGATPIAVDPTRHIVPRTATSQSQYSETGIMLNRRAKKN